MTALASTMISACEADLHHVPKLLYGQNAVNGKPQRGPSYYDCIGKVRDLIFRVAPRLWPGEILGSAYDSWTCPNYLQGAEKMGLRIERVSLADLRAGKDLTLPGDAHLFMDSSYSAQHIGIGDGHGKTYSMLNTISNFCLVPTASLNFPTLLVVHLGLTQEEELMSLPIGAPTGIARIGTEPDIRGIKPDGTTLVALPLGSDVVVYGESTVAGYTTDGTLRSKVYRISLDGEAYLLQRNATFTPIGADASHFVTLGVDGVDVYTTKV